VQIRCLSARINRHEAENARAQDETSCDPLGLESCAAIARDTTKRRWRIGGMCIGGGYATRMDGVLPKPEQHRLYLAVPTVSEGRGEQQYSSVVFNCGCFPAW
jgi:hypothetical protein